MLLLDRLYNGLKNGDLIKIPEQNAPFFKWSLQLKYLKQEDSGVYECVVQSSSLGRTSVLYRLKVLPSLSSFITSVAGKNLPGNYIGNNKESNLNMKVSNTSTRSRKSVLDSQNQNGWSTKLDQNLVDNKIVIGNLNKLGSTILNLRNVTIERLGQKAILRCVINGILAQPHFRWFKKLKPQLSEFTNSKQKLNEIKLSFDNQSIDLPNQLYQKNIILTLNSNNYQSLINDGQLDDEKRYRQNPNKSSIHQINHLKIPVDKIYIESFKIFLPDGEYSYASELTVKVDENTLLGEYLCVNFGASIHYKSAFIKLKDNLFATKFDYQYYTSSNSKVHENSSLNDNRYSYGWFDEDHLSNIAIIRHSPSSANKLNYLQHDKLNAPISAAITSDSQKISKRDNENIFLVIVPVTIVGIVVAIILFSLINYLKKIPDIPDLSTDQCLIVQQIKLAETETSNQSEQKENQNLIMNPLADENLDIDTIINSTIKLSEVDKARNQIMKSNQTNSNKIAQLNEIYHPEKGPHPHSHLLIKPTTNSTKVCYSTSIKRNLVILQQQKEDSSESTKLLNFPIENKQSVKHNLSTFYLNNKAQLDYEHSAFGTQNWPINCCTCLLCNNPSCNQPHLNRTPD